MSKFYALCLSLFVVGSLSANATNATVANKWKKQRPVSWQPISVQVMGKRTTATQQLKSITMASASANPDTPVSKTDAAPGFGFLTGPDGNQWYYTQTFEVKDYGYTSYYTKSVITVFDSSNTQVGQFTVNVPDSQQVNMIAPFGDITKKLFDRDESTYEIMLSLHAVGNAENNYLGTYTTQVYNINGGLVAEYGGAGIFFDASKGWNTYQRLIVPRTIYGDDGSETYAIDVVAPPSYGSTVTKVEHTFNVADSLTNYSSGSFLNCYVVDEKPYYVISYYEKPYVKYYDPETLEPVLNENNHYILETYDKSFNLVDSFSVALDAPTDAYARFASFGMMSDRDLSAGYFTPKGERAYVITFDDYYLSEDDKYTFVVYNSAGEALKTICDNATENQWWELSPIKGQSDQMIFLQAIGEAQQIQMVDIPSCEKKTLIPATINGDGITTTLDRYPVGDTYQYVIKMATADIDDDDNTIARIGWYTTDLKLDHMVKFNIGENGEYFTPLINDQSLNPFLFNTDDKMEYIYIAKKKRMDGSNKIDNVLEIANEDGEILRSYAGDGEWKVNTPAVLAMTPTKNQLMIGFKSDSTSEYKMDFYDLPFSKFNNGGDGTEANPYLVSTVGDLLQINNAPTAHYLLTNNIDFATYKSDWEPITESFTGTLDGNSYAISNLTINTDNAEVGLFSTVGTNSCVKNLTFTDPTITVNADNQYVGVIAGESATDTLTNVHIYNASIVAADTADDAISPSVGGLIGRAALYTEACACSFDGCINMPASSFFGGVGGIFGETLTSSSVTACATTGNITAGTNVGGIIGSQGTGSTVNDCDVIANLEANNTIGGITGSNSARGTINRCLVSGTITAKKAQWSGLSAGGIVGSLEANYTSAKDSVITNCVSAANIYLPEGTATDGTVHRIAGYTSANDTEKPKTEAGMSSNYAVSTATVAGETITSTDSTSVEGMDITTLDNTFFNNLGYAYGSDIDAPWKGAYTPALFFENTPVALLLSTYDASIVEGSYNDIEATVYGADAETISCTSSSADVADVEITDIANVDHSSAVGCAVLRITAKKAGTAVITVTAGEQKAECTVSVGTNGIAAVTSTPQMTIVQQDGAIKATGATNIKVYSIGGQVAGSTNTDAISTAKMSKGVYVVVATNGKGVQTTAKVVVK